MHLLNQKLSSQEANLICYGVTILEGTSFIGDVTLHNTYYFLLGNGHKGLAYAVTDVFNRNSFAIRRV